MYIDLIVLLVLIVVIIMYFKRFQSFVFFIAIIDILLRILTFIKYNTSLKDVSGLISKYFPENVLNIIDKYTKDMGVINTILRWGFLVIMIIFLSYIIKIFWKKKKI